MTKLLRSSHAEDVGGSVVEPGQPIPDDADPEVVKRLEAEGKVEDSSSSKSSGKSTKKG